jgi:hypothetical protein
LTTAIKRLSVNESARTTIMPLEMNPRICTKQRWGALGAQILVLSLSLLIGIAAGDDFGIEPAGTIQQQLSLIKTDESVQRHHVDQDEQAMRRLEQ